jgi:hypothetical protein
LPKATAPASLESPSELASWCEWLDRIELVGVSKGFLKVLCWVETCFVRRRGRFSDTCFDNSDGLKLRGSVALNRLRSKAETVLAAAPI